MPDVQIILEMMFIYGTKTFNILKVDSFMTYECRWLMFKKKNSFQNKLQAQKYKTQKPNYPQYWYFKTTKSSFTHEQFYS